MCICWVESAGNSAAFRFARICSGLQGLAPVVSVDRHTVERWRRWWRDTFTVTPFWQAARAAFMPPVDHAALPAALLDRFAGDAGDRLVALLRFLGPLTGGRIRTR